MTDLDATIAPRSYRPGTWYGVLGTHASVLLPPSERARVAGLWEVVDAGAGFDVVLDALLAGGLSDLPGFVLWSAADDVTQAVARGPVKVVLTTADGEEVLDGSEAATWAERRVAGIRSLRIEVEETAGPDLGLVSGLVRVGRVDEPAYAADSSPFVEDAEPADTADPVATEDVTGLEAAPEPVPDQDLVTDHLDDPLNDPLDAPFTAGTPVPDAEVTEVFAPTWSQTAPPVPPVAPPQPAPAPGWPGHDGGTRSGYDTDAPGPPGLVPHGIPGQPQAPAVTARPVARLVLSHGETIDVDRAVLVGRAPEARRLGPGEQPRLVTVPSPHQEISSTHLEVRPGSGADHGSAVVTDLGSTNGTVLVQPGLAPENLQPGIAVQLIPGAIVDLGDGVTIQVTNP